MTRLLDDPALGRDLKESDAAGVPDCQQFTLDSEDSVLKIPKVRPGWYFLLTLFPHGVQPNVSPTWSIKTVIHFAFVRTSLRRKTDSFGPVQVQEVRNSSERQDKISPLAALSNGRPHTLGCVGGPD
jgi:hypothetical protein